MAPTRNTRTKRIAVAVAATATAAVLSIGGALAAADTDGIPSQEPTASLTAQPDPTIPPDGGSGSATGGGSTGPDTGGTDTGGSGSGGGDPDPTSSPVPTDPSDIAGLVKRIDELDKKIDELPTKKELADALRAAADALDKP
ncbi:hypothetical protein ACLQ2E_05820 [Streptomyces lavendulocolor]